jgi:hypothetical protein
MRKTTTDGITTDASGQITKIDILGMEIAKNLPNWLHPSQNVTPEHAARRKAAAQKHAAEKNAKRKP